MTEARGRAEVEAEALARILGHRELTERVRERYRIFRDSEPGPESGDRGLQLAWLRRGGFAARLASVWAGRFDRHGPLRRREVAMLAFLECEPAAVASVDRCSDGGPIAAWPRLCLWGALEVFLLLLALPVFGTARLVGGRG